MICLARDFGIDRRALLLGVVDKVSITGSRQNTHAVTQGETALKLGQVSNGFG